MLTIENIDNRGSVMSISVESGRTNFMGSDHNVSERPHVKVTFWEHLDTDRKYNHLMPIASGYAFCMPSDDFDLIKGARLATERALDSIGITKGSSAKKVHKLVKKFVLSNPWI
jgi:hypothetical protein